MMMSFRADQVLGGPRQFADRFLAADFVFADARRLLENLAALPGLRVDDLIHAALLHDRVGIRSRARIQEHFRDVLEPAGDAVDLVFALARPEKAARNLDFGLIERKAAVLVGDGDDGLSVTERLERGRAVENDIAHPAASEALGRLLAKHPADRVEDIRLPAAVRADDDRHARQKLHHGFQGEALETYQLEPFEEHEDEPFSHAGRGARKSLPEAGE